MKIVYVVHVEGKNKKTEEVLLPDKDPGDTLTEEDLERIFEAHNLAEKKKLPSLTGYHDYLPLKDYVVDVENTEVWSCEPTGWKKLISSLR